MRGSENVFCTNYKKIMVYNLNAFFKGRMGSVYLLHFDK